MKRSLFLLACLLGAGSLSAQRPETESPVFFIDGTEIPTAGLKTASAATDSLIPWSLPDTIIGSRTAGEYALFVYTYDERGNAVVTESFQRAGEAWYPSQRIESSYNRWDLVDTTSSSLYQQGSYVPNARKISTYDNQGRRTTLTNAGWVASVKKWSNSSRYLYTYTDKGQLQSSVKEGPDNFTGEWGPTEKIEYTYDEEGRETAFEMSLYSGGGWMPYRAYYRTYQDGRLVRELGRIINDVTGTYGDTYRFEWHYNADGNLTDHLQFYTDSTGAWEKDTTLHRKLVYNEDGLQTEEHTRTYDAALGALENSVREYYFYNDKKQKDSVKHEVWLSLAWEHTISLRYFYDEAGVINSRIYYNLTADNRRTDKYEFEFNEDGDGTLSECFTLNNNDWTPAERYDLEISKHDGEVILRANELRLCKISAHYATGFKTPGPLPDTTTPRDTTAVEPLKALLDANLRVYPNPATETLYVDLADEGAYGYEVELTDLSGHTMTRCRLTAGRHAMDVSPYKGIYILRVTARTTATTTQATTQTTSQAPAGAQASVFRKIIVL